MMTRLSRVSEAVLGRMAPDDWSLRGLTGGRVSEGKKGVRAGREIMGSTLK